MGSFLNSLVPYEAYRAVTAGRYFVDKSAMIEELLPSLEQETRFFCITRPRRFGKSIMANMLGAFFGKAADAGSLFDSLEISGSVDYRKHLNKHQVISWLLGLAIIERRRSIFVKWRFYKKGRRNAFYGSRLLQTGLRPEAYGMLDL